jgi:hypothetical protein
MPESAVYVEGWAQSYGSPYLVKNDDSGATEVEVVEDGGAFAMHAPLGVPQRRTLVFIDGVRRGEASLYQILDDGRVVRGVAGAHACGAVTVAPDGTATFAETRLSRMVIWGSGRTGDLPPAAGGWSWESHSIAGDEPQAPLDALQQRMRNAEGRLAASLCANGCLVVADGPLDYAKSSPSEWSRSLTTRRRPCYFVRGT